MSSVQALLRISRHSVRLHTSGTLSEDQDTWAFQLPEQNIFSEEFRSGLKKIKSQIKEAPVNVILADDLVYSQMAAMPDVKKRMLTETLVYSVEPVLNNSSAEDFHPVHMALDRGTVLLSLISKKALRVLTDAFEAEKIRLKGLLPETCVMALELEKRLSRERIKQGALLLAEDHRVCLIAKNQDGRKAFRSFNTDLKASDGYLKLLLKIKRSLRLFGFSDMPVVVFPGHGLSRAFKENDCFGLMSQGSFSQLRLTEEEPEKVAIEALESFSRKDISLVPDFLWGEFGGRQWVEELARPLTVAAAGFFVFAMSLMFLLKSRTDELMKKYQAFGMQERKSFKQVFKEKEYSQDLFVTLPNAILDRFISSRNDVAPGEENPIEALRLTFSSLPVPEKCNYRIRGVVFNRSGAEISLQTEGGNPQANAISLEKMINRKGMVTSSLKSLSVHPDDRRKARFLLTVKKNDEASENSQVRSR